MYCPVHDLLITIQDPLPSAVQPADVRARLLPDINGIDVRVLEAGFETSGRPPVLLHGVPAWADSWR